MAIVTAIKPQKRGDKRVNVFLDDVFAFSLKIEVAQELGLREGQVLSPLQVEELPRLDSFRRCLDAALQLLSYRPRSESEMRLRLGQRGFDDNSIERAMVRLREMGLLDDGAFARYWVDNRDTFSPRSRRLLHLELRRKGVDTDIINEVVAGIDESAGAYCAAQKKSQALRGCDYHTFYRKLGLYLQRRGFSYGVIRQTVDRLWQEVGEGGDSDSD